MSKLLLRYYRLHFTKLGIKQIDVVHPTEETAVKQRSAIDQSNVLVQVPELPVVDSLHFAHMLLNT